MRSTHSLSIILLSQSITAISIRQDDCSNIKCNDAGCDGTNNFLEDGSGQCMAGDCVGLPCSLVCPSDPSAQISCNQFGCVALYDGIENSWTCSSGDYAGCPCQDSCPSTLPNCNDPVCSGSSNAVDQYGICGSPDLSDCACINSCPVDPANCSADDCRGLNNPNGGDSVCTEGSRMGCPCKSSCPASVACNDPECFGYNNADNATASFCTDGTYMGCRCISQCGAADAAGQLGLNNCNGNDCRGINNLGGDEFCTAGNWRGCHCNSNCPSTSMTCSDGANCDGFEGLCTLGDAIGCPCTGDSPVRRSSTTRTLVVRADDDDLVDRIPFAYYVCAPRRGTAGETRSYSRTDIHRAINRAFELAMDGEQITAAGNSRRRYPQRFTLRGRDAANWNIPNRARLNVNRLIEFPIIRDATGRFVPFTDGMDQGPDRVVFDGVNGAFVGVFTHRGENNNAFHQAIGHNQDENIPPLDPELDFGPTILDSNPFPWYIGGSGDLPLKRTPTYPPPSFPTTYTGCPNTDGQCYCYDTITTAGYFPRDAALQAIDQACNDWDGQTIQTNGQLESLSTTKQINLDGITYSIELTVWQILLVSVGPSKVDKGTCGMALMSAMDNCQTGTRTQKMGGEFVHYIAGVGSQMYLLHPGEGNPPPLVMSAAPQEPWNT